MRQIDHCSIAATNLEMAGALFRHASTSRWFLPTDAPSVIRASAAEAAIVQRWARSRSLLVIADVTRLSNRQRSGSISSYRRSMSCRAHELGCEESTLSAGSENPRYANNRKRSRAARRSAAPLKPTSSWAVSSASTKSLKARSRSVINTILKILGRLRRWSRPSDPTSIPARTRHMRCSSGNRRYICETTPYRYTDRRLRPVEIDRKSANGDDIKRFHLGSPHPAQKPARAR